MVPKVKREVTLPIQICQRKDIKCIHKMKRLKLTKDKMYTEVGKIYSKNKSFVQIIFIIAYYYNWSVQLRINKLNPLKKKIKERGDPGSDPKLHLIVIHHF